MAHLLFHIVAALTAAVAVLATQVNQLAFPFVRTIAFARLDPIVYPGAVSGHVHKFLGASRVSPDAEFSSLQESECTTHPITADLSSYWMPAFYHHSADGYKLLDSGDNIVYYGTAGDDVQAFPDNFKMVTGSPTQTCAEGPERYFVCIKDDRVLHTVTLPQDQECDMLGGHVTFPSCWDGKDFDLESQQAHLVMPLGGALGAKCPASHPTKLPALMMDLWANATGLPVNKDGPTYSLSFGDTVGCGLHADFMNGWNRDVLQAAMTECKDFNGDMDVSTCPPLTKYYNREAEAKCQFQSDVPDENIGLTTPIEKLVYCNPEEDDAACAKQNEGVHFVSELTTIDVLGIPLPIPIAVLHPSASEPAPSHEPTPTSTRVSSSHSHRTSPTSTQRMVTSSRPRPSGSVSARPTSSPRPTPSASSGSGFPFGHQPSGSGFPSGVSMSWGSGRWPRPSGTGAPRPHKSGSPGPIWRPPPGEHNDGGGGGDGSDDC